MAFIPIAHSSDGADPVSDRSWVVVDALFSAVKDVHECVHRAGFQVGRNILWKPPIEISEVSTRLAVYPLHTQIRMMIRILAP